MLLLVPLIRLALAASSACRNGLDRFILWKAVSSQLNCYHSIMMAQFYLLTSIFAFWLLMSARLSLVLSYTSLLE